MPPLRYLWRISAAEKGTMASGESSAPSSISTTSRPASASRHAVTAPPGPDPITATSVRRSPRHAASPSGEVATALHGEPREHHEALVEADQVPRERHRQSLPGGDEAPARTVR